MNNFEKELSVAARALRDKQDAALSVPTPPRVGTTKKKRPFIGWTGIAAALCVGYFLGIASHFYSSESLKPLAQVSKSEIVHDTIFTTLCDTLFIEREVPVYITVPAEKNLAVALPATDIMQMASQKMIATSDMGEGRSILDDTIHYALLVSM